MRTRAATHDRGAARRSPLSMAVLAMVVASMALVWTGCDSEAMVTADASERDMALRVLQADSRMLAYADVDSQLEAGRRMLGQNGDVQAMMDDVMNRVAEMTDIQLDEDVRGVYVGMQELGENVQGGMVGFVDYDQETLASQAADLEGMVRIDTQWPVDAFAVEGDEGQAAVAFAEGSLILMATDPEMLDRMLNRAYAESSTSSMDPLLDAVANRNAWVVIRDLGPWVDALSSGDGASELALLRPLLGGIADLAMGMDQNGEQLSGEIIIRPNGTISVDDYESLLSGARAMLRLQLRDLEAASEMIDRIAIDASGEWVSLKMDVTREDLMRLEAEIRSLTASNNPSAQ